MERWAGKVAVVTGASAGIGLETAKALVRNGMTVVGLARREDKMKREMKEVNGPGKFYAISCDIANEYDVINAFQWIEENLESVHVLVNNAGIFIAGSIQDSKIEDFQRTIDVNVMGLLHCTRQALKLMKKNNHEAHIVNVNSCSGHRVPFIQTAMNVYPATKFAVTALCQTLIYELKSDKIRVTSISPGLVKTEIFDHNKLDLEKAADKKILNPEDVANSIIHVISAPPHVQITELIIKPLEQMY